MGTSLERRVETLEAAGGGNLPDVVIMREIVSPGHVGDPVTIAEIDGQRYEREVGESEERFIVRVGDLARERRQATGNRRALVILRADDEDI